MQNTEHLSSIPLTVKNTIPNLDPVIKFPRILKNESLNTSPSPFNSNRSHSQTSSFPTEAPILSYINYKPYHKQENPPNSPRKVSNSPFSHEFYRPQVLRISPRARLTVFTVNPIVSEDSSKKSQVKTFKKKLKRLGRQSKCIQNFNSKPNPPLYELGPAWSIGEMMWKLTNLTPLGEI